MGTRVLTRGTFSSLDRCSQAAGQKGSEDSLWSHWARPWGWGPVPESPRGEGLGRGGRSPDVSVSPARPDTASGHFGPVNDPCCRPSHSNVISPASGARSSGYEFLHETRSLARPPLQAEPPNCFSSFTGSPPESLCQVWLLSHRPGETRTGRSRWGGRGGPWSERLTPAPRPRSCGQPEVFTKRHPRALRLSLSLVLINVRMYRLVYFQEGSGEKGPEPFFLSWSKNQLRIEN